METEIERFSPDKDWMPNVVMMAKSTLVWLHQLSVAYGRDISSGGNLYTEALRGLGMSAGEAESRKRGTLTADPEIQQHLLQVSEAIAAEIQRSLDFFRGAVAEEPLSRIVLTGGSAQVPSFREALAGRSRLPVTLLDPFARVEVERRVELGALQTHASAAAVAFGLALRAEDETP